MSLLRTHLADWQSGWSMGSFGALAEFHQDDGEVAVLDNAAELKRATRRGAIRIERRRMKDIVPVAYETLSPKRHRWSQALALCLPDAEARRARRTVLTELGPDDEAIRGVDRTGILFDMGLSLPQCDFCIHTSEPKLLAELRAHSGSSVLEPGNPVMASILKGHPHRVTLTDIGRLEVYQKIGDPDTNGLLPLAHLHPGNPAVGPMGEERPFDHTLFNAFQSLPKEYGPDHIVAAKSAILTALDVGAEPASVRLPKDRFERSAMRLAVRQQRVVAGICGDVEQLRRLAAWSEAYDPGSIAGDEDDDAPGH